ncbi:sporulation membrane protein YtaF [Tenuibacillus multivorans]|uniref:Putative sporulation protein YtaF n=1 Tax=Tenuibacillus multivorans TaxID=237069 RepID=A0A1G9ZSN1_9BACI|nr:sporulation membrane protein YtaF [Tenuibacillus multivorans]GEL76835.1 sporulation membrane protein YtaF [Tenuibacillus multivorans]SDN24278.1 putative sporulation protein YtaF [Tenuibacillus multivorans]
MEQLWVILLLSFAVSFDSFFFGFTYSLRSIKVKLSTYMIIGLVTSISFLAGYLLGDVLSYLIPQITDYLGGFIFVFVGLYIIWQWVDEQREKLKKYYQTTQIKWNLKTFWLILKDPQLADLDHSGTISGKESFMVAFALSLDSFGSGVGSAFTALPHFLTASMVGLSAMIFLATGSLIGRILHSYKWMQQLSFLPGIIFIFLGIWNFTK